MLKVDNKIVYQYGDIKLDMNGLDTMIIDAHTCVKC